MDVYKSSHTADELEAAVLSVLETRPYADGYLDGKDAERKAFWDEFQNCGERTDYARAFASSYWNHVTFKPIYDLKPVGDARNMFERFGRMPSQAEDQHNLTDILSAAGVTLDTSRVTIAQTMFYAIRLFEVPPLDLTAATNVQDLFYDAVWLETAEITLAPNKVTKGSGMFSSCAALTNLTVHGVLDFYGIDLHWSTKLTKPSFVSVITALSSDTTGLTVTFSRTAKEAAFTADEWAALIATKPNWTFSLM